MQTYKKRHIEKKVKKLLALFPIVAVTGPRQSGKSTLIKHFIDARWQYYSLDNSAHLLRIQRDPHLFTKEFSSHIAIDEAQKAPELFPALKALVDSGFPYKIIISGSANFLLLQSITESLAGRVGIVELLPFSMTEYFREHTFASVWDVIFSSSSADQLYQSLVKRKQTRISEAQVLECILFGGYPKLSHLHSASEKWEWLAQYVTTYIERDLRNLAHVADLSSFQQTYKLLAYQTAQIINMSSVAHDLGITSNTVKRYTSILETSYQCTFLPAFAASRKKQLIKAPKVMYGDTGLVNFFMAHQNKDAMLYSGHWGAILETWVYLELYKYTKTMTPQPSLLYWRTHNGAEVDCIIERGGGYIPIEVKAAMTLSPLMFRSMKQFIEEHAAKVSFGIVFYRGDAPYYVEKNIIAIPIGML